MGWTKSHKIFKDATKTVADVTNTQLCVSTKFGPHPLEVQSETPAPTTDVAPAIAMDRVPNPVLCTEHLPHGERPKGAAHYRTHISL
jgi:hypothetical protein